MKDFSRFCHCCLNQIFRKVSHWLTNVNIALVMKKKHKILSFCYFRLICSFLKICFLSAASDQEPEEWNREESPGAELWGDLLCRHRLAAAAWRWGRHAVWCAAETLSGHCQNRQGQVRGVERRHQPCGSVGKAWWVWTRVASKNSRLFCFIQSFELKLWWTLSSVRRKHWISWRETWSINTNSCLNQNIFFILMLLCSVPWVVQ